MIDEQRLQEIEQRATDPESGEDVFACVRAIPDLVAALREAQERIAQLEPINKAVNDWVDSRLAILGKETSPGFADECLLEAVLGKPERDE